MKFADSICEIVSFISSIIFSIISIGITYFVYKQQEKLQKKIDFRDEKKYENENHSLAISFIQKYNNKCEDDLLALCYIAGKLNVLENYHRPIYKKRVLIKDDVKEEIIKIKKSDLANCELCKNFYDEIIKKTKKLLINNYIDGEEIVNRLFNGENSIAPLNYFKNNKPKLITDFTIGKYKSRFGMLDYSFSDFLEDVLSKNLNDKIVKLNYGSFKNKTISIEKLTKEKDLMLFFEILNEIYYIDNENYQYLEFIFYCFIIMYPAIYLSMKNDNSLKFLEYPSYCDALDGRINDKTCEDLFLEAMFTVYNLNDEIMDKKYL